MIVKEPIIGSFLDLSTIVRPMQERLALARPAGEVAIAAIVADLREVAGHCTPSFDLARVLGRNSPSHPVAAIPLEPSARIVFVYPAFCPPYGKRLAGVYFE